MSARHGTGIGDVPRGLPQLAPQAQAACLPMTATNGTSSVPYRVFLNVYDVSRTSSASTNTTILRLNNVTREIGLGGVFHGAVQIFGDYEWSFGFCEKGTGVYSCRARQNPAYTYREAIDLGTSELRRDQVKELLARLKAEWPGRDYELLNRNCCHFCEVLCKELGVKSPPGWLNRFAAGADAMVTLTNEASALARTLGTNISRSAATASSWLRESWTRIVDQPAAVPAGSTSYSGSGVASERGGHSPAPGSSPLCSGSPYASGSGGFGRSTVRRREEQQHHGSVRNNLGGDRMNLFGSAGCLSSATLQLGGCDGGSSYGPEPDDGNCGRYSGGPQSLPAAHGSPLRLASGEPPSPLQGTHRPNGLSSIDLLDARDLTNTSFFRQAALACEEDHLTQNEDHS